jgi:peroxisomal 3,2-trans-enoyl-CoA isomerase
MGRTFTAEELERCNLISRLIPKDSFRTDVLALAEEAAKFSPEAMKVTKELIRGFDREILLQVNDVEMKRLTERMASKESQDSIMKFVGE